MESLSLTSLRTKLFKVADHVIKTGIPVEIYRNGHVLKLILDKKKSKLNNLKSRNCINGNPDDLVDIKVANWDEEPNL